MRSDSLLRQALVGIVVAAVGVAIVWLIADAASGPLMANGPDGELAEVPLGGAVFAVVIGGLVGTGIAFLLRRLGRGAPVFLGVCVVGLVLYGIWAFSQAENTATGVWLNVMHIVAAVPIVGLLTQWLQTRVTTTS
ncbi:MAG: DUF6069 family protein [Actinomycetota bacterium]